MATKAPDQAMLPGAAEAAEAITDKRRKELRAEQLRLYLKEVVSKKRVEGQIVTTCKADLVPSHRFRRDEVATLTDCDVIICPAGKEKPELQVHLKAMTCRKGADQGAEAGCTVTLIGDKRMNGLLGNELEVYVMEEPEDPAGDAGI